ncbi:MAG: wax ester/triacylglycerol synthase family O-acyltransferase [Chloroflexales bacterium]|nr:wax ester/triacylglycerol synthase family O-acyltransferase [Chloroflexales bacterium]
MSPSQRTRTPLASVDAAWLHMDEPTNPMVITVALTFDQPIDFKRLREIVSTRLLCFPRFSQRVVDGRGSAPHWEDDPRFAVEAHVHRIGLPGAGDDIALRELLSDLISTPLDPTRPLWQMYLVERYDGEGCVMVLRVHHCMADGVALVQVFNSLLDPPPTNGIVPAHTNGFHGIVDNAFELIGAAVRSTEAIMHEGWAWVSHPERALNLLGSSAAVLSKLALMGPDAPSILKGPLSMSKRVAWSAPVPLADVKAIGKAMGGTVNDVILTAVAGALRRYLLGHAAPISERGLRAMVPVNLLPPGAKSDGGNHFGLVYVTLPLGVESAAERMARLRKEMDAIKASPEAYIGYGVVGLLGVMPTGVEHTLLEALCSMASMVVTNVPGPRVANALAGKPVRRAVFWVPEAAGLGLGISILSYVGSVHVGVLADAALVPDPELIAEAFDVEIAELVAMEREAASG